jgi:hypothetical protein
MHTEIHATWLVRRTTSPGFSRHVSELSRIIHSQLRDELPFEFKNIVGLHEQLDNRQRIFAALKDLLAEPGKELQAAIGKLAAEYRELIRATIDTADALKARIQQLDAK